MNINLLLEKAQNIHFVKNLMRTVSQKEKEFLGLLGKQKSQGQDFMK
jgi:hypothetical protein